MPRHSVASRLNDASKLSAVNTENYTFMVLETDKLIPSTENFYGLREIEELADNMLIAGNIEPVIVGKVNGEYKIISGHRRWNAVVLNKQRGHAGFDKIACMVKEMSYNMFMFTLLSANAFTRRLTDVELVTQAASLKEYTKKLKEEEGLQIQGKMRDYLAENLGVSVTKMNQIESINNNLSEEGMAAFKAGEMNFSKAYETSRLPLEMQSSVVHDKDLLSGEVRKIVKDSKKRNTNTSPSSGKEAVAKTSSLKNDADSSVEYSQSQLYFLKKEIAKYQRWLQREKDMEKKQRYQILRDALCHYYEIYKKL